MLKELLEKIRTLLDKLPEEEIKETFLTPPLLRYEFGFIEDMYRAFEGKEQILHDIPSKPWEYTPTLSESIYASLSGFLENGKQWIPFHERIF